MISRRVLCEQRFLNAGSYLSTAAEEVGAENFFAQESKLDLANVCSEGSEAESIEIKGRKQDGHNLSDDENEDPAFVEKV